MDEKDWLERQALKVQQEMREWPEWLWKETGLSPKDIGIMPFQEETSLTTILSGPKSRKMNLKPL